MQNQVLIAQSKKNSTSRSGKLGGIGACLFLLPFPSHPPSPRSDLLRTNTARTGVMELFKAANNSLALPIIRYIKPGVRQEESGGEGQSAPHKFDLLEDVNSAW